MFPSKCHGAATGLVLIDSNHGIVQRQLPEHALPAGKASGTRTKLSTLVRPFGLAKTLPLVVHTSGNTVYEEPCLAYLHLHITKACCSVCLTVDPGT